jgi:hypothetical protein
MAKKKAKDHSYLFLAVVSIVAIIGLIVVFTSFAPSKQSIKPATNLFAQAGANNLYGQAVMPVETKFVLPMQCSCGQGISCTGVYTGEYVDCSCCIEE